MKRKVALIAGLAAILSGALAACNEDDGTISVSFVQNGQTTIVKTLSVGETLAEIPTPVQKEGYKISWDRKDFRALTQSLTVTAVETPNVYTISYEAGENAVLAVQTQSVTFGEDFTLATPTAAGKTFVGWQIDGSETLLQSGKYTLADSVTLVAVWDVQNTDEYTYVY